jgi:RepB DNA-primase from phage plasmid
VDDKTLAETTVNSSLIFDFDEAERFLTELNYGPEGQFTFLALDDNKRRGGPPSREKHGKLSDFKDFFRTQTARGYGAFVTVNQTDLNGREAKNIIYPRALFVDLDSDGARKLREVQSCDHPPDIIVESSRGKFHCYWLNDGSITLDQFTPLQKGLITKFGGDKSIHDLPRIMRIPGSWHQKVSKDGVRSEPFMTRLIAMRARSR